MSTIDSKDLRLNGEILISQCRLIDENGNQHGIVNINEARLQADRAGLDLVEIAPNSNPSVCKIMNYGKYKYNLSQKAKQAKKNQTRIEVKEMKFRPKIDIGDYNTKKKHVLRFLNAGNKVKITIMFRGREMAYTESGLKILERLATDLEDIAYIEHAPKMEGRNMHMLIAPMTAFQKNKRKKKLEAMKAEKAKAAEKETASEMSEEVSIETTADELSAGKN
ncbi:MAG: translation initiation factor IF-3 [Eggerthellaceae bacterium]|nr:translation initiation factor IF-3 [Eggerthellaceae bacterium]